MRRDERGSAELLVALGVTGLIFVAALAPVVIREVTSAVSGGGGWRPTAPLAGASLTGPVSQFIGPPPAGTPEVQKCIKEKMDGKGFTFTATDGWRTKSGAFSPPSSVVGMDAKVYRGQVIAWKEGFNAIVLQEYNDAKKVCETPEKPIEPRKKPVVDGRYRIDIPENQTCSGPFGRLLSQIRSATAQGSGDSFTLTVDGFGAMNGTLSNDLYFDVKGSPGVVAGVTMRMQGQFVIFGEDTLIRGGSLVVSDATEQCQTSFTGERLK